MDQAEPTSSRIPTSSRPVAVQTKITTSIRQSSDDAYLRMLRAAHTLALEPTLPSRQFHTLIKVQRENGIRLIEREHFYLICAYQIHLSV